MIEYMGIGESSIKWSSCILHRAFWEKHRCFCACRLVLHGKGRSIDADRNRLVRTFSFSSSKVPMQTVEITSMRV